MNIRVSSEVTKLERDLRESTTLRESKVLAEQENKDALLQQGRAVNIRYLFFREALHNSDGQQTRIFYYLK